MNRSQAQLAGACIRGAMRDIGGTDHDMATLGHHPAFTELECRLTRLDYKYFGVRMPVQRWSSAGRGVHQVSDTGTSPWSAPTNSCACSVCGRSSRSMTERILFPLCSTVCADEEDHQ